MLGYQHGYHAGNFADVLKHIVLIEVLNYLKRKETALCYIDTHAGRGIYRLEGPEAQKNKEYMTGIGRLLERADPPGGVAPYVSTVREFNSGNQLNTYPGSPVIAAHLLRKQDRLFCYELHPREFRVLQEQLKADKRIKTYQNDGFNSSGGLLPPKERRGLVLIDPPYELKTDYQNVVSALQAFYKRFPGGCYLLWYPVVTRSLSRAMERALKTSGIKNMLLLELGVKPDAPGLGMTACGLIIVNPPWALADEMKALMPWLAETLGENQQGHYRIEQLVAE